MRFVLLLLIGLTSFAYADGGIVKCTDANGKVSFGDAACGASTKSEAVDVRPNVVKTKKAASSYGASSPGPIAGSEMERRIMCVKSEEEYNEAAKTNPEEARRIRAIINQHCN